MENFAQTILTEQTFIAVIFTVLLAYMMHRNRVREDKYIEMLDYYYRMKNLHDKE